MKLVTIVLSLFLIFLVSCQDTLIGSKPQPQPVQEENTTEPDLMNLTNQTPVESVPQEVEVFYPRENNLTIYFLDVNGDSSLVQEKDNSILIDSGYENDSNKVLNSIRNIGIDNLDYIFATNTHQKNVGGMPYIILRTSPDNIIENGIPSNTTSYKELYEETTTIKRDTFFDIGGFFVLVYVVYDDGLGFAKNPDDNSLVTKINYGNIKILLMSDCGFECEERLRDSDLSADIIKISNSCDANSLSFLQNVNPDMAVVSTTDSNFCPNIVSRFKYLDVPLYQTTNGDIFVTTDGLGYYVGQKKE